MSAATARERIRKLYTGQTQPLENHLLQEIECLNSMFHELRCSLLQMQLAVEGEIVNCKCGSTFNCDQIIRSINLS